VGKKYIKIVYDPVNDWYFSRKYKNNDILLKNIGGTSVSFDTSIDISNKWFYPRYEGEKVHEPVVTNYLIDRSCGVDCW
jgi:hypothetical protein